MSSLKDKWVVITRPAQQAKSLQKKCVDAGANVILFPLLEIKEPINKALLKQQLDKITDYDLVIFISPNAVEQCFKNIQTKQLSSSRIAAVGQKTQKKLEEYGLKVNISPKSLFNTESLLALPEIKNLGTNNHVAIIRGEGGRELLKDSLQSQGVNVEYINAYQRFCPQSSLEPLTKNKRLKQLDIILLTSGNSAANLFDLKGVEADNDWLDEVSFLVGSKRIKQQILSSTSHKGAIFLAEDPSDETMYQQLLTWSNNGNNENV